MTHHIVGHLIELLLQLMILRNHQLVPDKQESISFLHPQGLLLTLLQSDAPGVFGIALLYGLDHRLIRLDLYGGRYSGLQLLVWKVGEGIRNCVLFPLDVMEVVAVLG